MVTETEAREVKPSLLAGLAVVGGLGIVAMILAASVGAVDPNIDSQAISLVLLSGLGAVVIACVTWFAVVQPNKHFDNINEPLDNGHGH